MLQKYCKRRERGNILMDLKEEYIKEIKAIGQHLIDNAENILFDYELEKIREINIISNIRFGEIPTVEINKSYIPKEVM